MESRRGELMAYGGRKHIIAHMVGAATKASSACGSEALHYFSDELTFHCYSGGARHLFADDKCHARRVPYMGRCAPASRRLTSGQRKRRRRREYADFWLL